MSENDERVTIVETWTPDRVTYQVDNEVVRVLTLNPYPQYPYYPFILIQPWQMRPSD